MIAVNVAQLLKAPVGTPRSFNFREIEPELSTELGIQGPLGGCVKLVRTSHGILVDCQYHVQIGQECGRCLGPTRCTLDARFSQEFLPTTNVFSGLPEQIVADPDEPRIDANHVLDLTDVIRQDIVVQQPLQPLCRPDCAGLCAICGQDLNETRCACEPAEASGGLSRLGELLKRELG
ncbi:MAG TPA: DUF177 domain-containing protein [Chloroflexota bacterium]|nr:DUF177 domain-containing protein [Chloroflexota bacterium]